MKKNTLTMALMLAMSATMMTGCIDVASESSDESDTGTGSSGSGAQIIEETYEGETSLATLATNMQVDAFGEAHKYQTEMSYIVEAFETHIFDASGPEGESKSGQINSSCSSGTLSYSINIGSDGGVISATASNYCVSDMLHDNGVGEAIQVTISGDFRMDADWSSDMGEYIYTLDGLALDFVDGAMDIGDVTFNGVYEYRGSDETLYYEELTDMVVSTSDTDIVFEGLEAITEDGNTFSISGKIGHSEYGFVNVESSGVQLGFLNCTDHSSQRISDGIVSITGANDTSIDIDYAGHEFSYTLDGQDYYPNFSCTHPVY